MKGYYELDAFDRAAFDTMVWTAEGYDMATEETFDGVDESLAHLIWDLLGDPVKAKFLSDCEEFYAEYGLLFDDDAQAGQDFTLTRQRQGAGFWDGDYPEHGDELTRGAHAAGSSFLSIGFSPGGEPVEARIHG